MWCRFPVGIIMSMERIEKRGKGSFRGTWKHTSAKLKLTFYLLLPSSWKKHAVLIFTFTAERLSVFAWDLTGIFFFYLFFLFVCFSPFSGNQTVKNIQIGSTFFIFTGNYLKKRFFLSYLIFDHFFVGCVDFQCPSCKGEFPILFHSAIFRSICVGHYLEVIVVHLTVMLVVVWVVHLI